MWDKVLNSKMELDVLTNSLPTKGKLVYEYNPFHNYRLSENKYSYKDNLYTLRQLEDQFGIIPGFEESDKCLGSKDGEKSTILGIKTNEIYNDHIVLNKIDDIELHEKGELLDFNTDELKFSLKNPVQIIPQYSYDGSVNLILNDGINIPRLINSRFSATGKNTYEIIDRKGNNDTNIYDSGEQFDIDTSLYKIVTKIPKVELLSVSSGGQLKIGNYHFYFKLADADGNETDFVAESGLVSVFIGEGSYSSVHTGTKNENSAKQVIFRLSDIDSAYDYITVYYSRYTAEAGENMETEYIKIDKKYSRQSSKIVITGFEPTIPITIQDINLQYNLVNAVETSAVCQNMLFMGNVHKQEIPYEELQDLSLRIYPKVKYEQYTRVSELYKPDKAKQTYVDPLFIYNNTGYWPGELYRFGIVYIMPNGELSPVFNIRGAIDIVKVIGTNGEIIPSLSSNIIPEKLYTDDGQRFKIPYNENTNLFTESESTGIRYENVKGVCSLKPNSNISSSKVDYQILYSFEFIISEEVRAELSKYIKGFFFVRQTRMPLILAQGLTLGIDKESRTPTIPTAAGFLIELQDGLEKTHVETEDINGLNYISEGFLRRYTFKFKKKSSGLWSKIGKIAGIAAAVVGMATATIVTFGGAAVATAVATIGGALCTAAVGTTAAFTIGSAFVIGVGVAAGAIAGATVGGTIAVTQEIGQAVKRIGAKKRLNGKNTKAPSGYKIVETDESRLLTDEFLERIIIKDPTHNDVNAILCPDYTVNQSYYNQIFTGNNHYIETDLRQSASIEANSYESYLSNNGRHFYIGAYTNITSKQSTNCEIIAVEDNIKATGISQTIFRSRAGEAEEAWQYEYIAEEMVDTDNRQKNSDIIRGCFSPYLACLNKEIGPAKIVNIYIPGYDPTLMQEYIEIRMHDNSTYQAVTDRYSINPETTISSNIQQKDQDMSISVYRGDCYLCQYSQRINRNFNDPSALYNDEIVDEKTWKDNYDPTNSEKYSKINLGDVNAIPLGMWVTFQLRSSNNLNIRTLDYSNVDETAMTGHPRGYFPYLPMSTEGVYKTPDSGIYNKGFTKSVSDKWNLSLPDVPYIKNWYGTRIMYSDVHVNDGFKNGFRIFRGQNYRDYTREYGEIVKLISLESSLLCVFEHGVALIPVNERTIAGEGVGGPVYINTSNVLPENPIVLSDMYGSQWADSVLKVPGKTGDAVQYVYGVDTIAKKIWRTDGRSFQCISDMRVQEFLNNNITLGERELTPILGIRNVKTVYNAFKRDVLFTFYDNTYGFEEKVWNLCWNELLEKFITFYSWVPSYMENINNTPFSFDRNTSKWIAKLGTSHVDNSFADGITLTNNIINNVEDSNHYLVDNFSFKVPYITINGDTKYIYGTVQGEDREKFIGVLSLSNRTLPDKQMFYQISYSLERDNYLNYKKFEIFQVENMSAYYYRKDNGVSSTQQENIQITTVQKQEIDKSGLLSWVNYKYLVLPQDAKFAGQKIPVFALRFKRYADDEYEPIYYLDSDSYQQALSLDGNEYNPVYLYNAKYNSDSIISELYYRNAQKHVYADDEHNKIDTTIPPTTGYVPIEIIPNDDSGLEGWAACWISSRERLNKLKQCFGDTKVIIGNARLKGEDVTKPETYGVPEYMPYPCTNLAEIESLITGDPDNPMVHGIPLKWHWVIQAEEKTDSSKKVWLGYPIFKDLTGKRPMLKREDQINPDKIVTLLNIKANITVIDTENVDLSTNFMNMKAGFNSGTSLIDVGYYQSVVAIIPQWNIQFLSTDFWKHGQASIIDIADDIYPTYWYGKQHPFEFEFVVVNDPSVHKIFTNLEIVANKAKPESFHYEVVGESYDFAKDKVNMYFRQEALKALWQYNGADIVYDRNFLKVQTRQQPKSADLQHRYLSRQDTINEIEDYYIHVTYPTGYDYRHLSGGEIMYYPNRQEFRVWSHALAVDQDSLSQDDARSVIAANCRYLEDKWRVTINPLLVCYKNEYTRKVSGALVQSINSTWANAKNGGKLPPFAIYNSPIPDQILAKDEIEVPLEGDNALVGLYQDIPNSIDTTNWLNDVGIYRASFGEAQNRKELDLKDKFIKIRIRYSGEELAIIDFINTIYKVSYS